MNITRLLSGALSGALTASIAFVAYAEVSDYKMEHALADYAENQQCLALNIYHEARGESKLAQKAVGFVTLNRVFDKRYPNTICDVVYDAHLDSRGNPIRNKCQFSWYCDGKSDVPKSEESWLEAKESADAVMATYGIVEDYTEGAVMYHAAYVNPYWAESYEKTVRIDTHIFYK